MMGTVLGMAPAFVLGQLCAIVDLDGAIFLTKDRVPSVNYDDGYVNVPHHVWGDGFQDDAGRQSVTALFDGHSCCLFSLVVTDSICCGRHSFFARHTAIANIHLQ